MFVEFTGKILTINPWDFTFTVPTRVQIWWLGSRVVSVLYSGADGLGSNRSRNAVG